MRVAIVDDDESVCRAMARLLRVAGIGSSTFASAADFLALGPQGFGCVLVDVRLGEGMSGLELHRHLVEQGSRTPVVYLTASDDPAVDAAARQVGCAAFIRKGDPPESILEVLLRISA